MTTETAPPVKAIPVDDATFDRGDQSIVPPKTLASGPAGNRVHATKVVVVLVGIVDVVVEVVVDVVVEVVVDVVVEVEVVVVGATVVVGVGGVVINGVENRPALSLVPPVLVQALA